MTQEEEEYLIKEMNNARTKSEKAYQAGLQYEHEYWSGKADAYRDMLSKSLKYEEKK